MAVATPIILALTHSRFALGRVPGFVMDRGGTTLLGATAMVIRGVLTVKTALGAINVPTILLLWAQARLDRDRACFVVWSLSAA